MRRAESERISYVKPLLSLGHVTFLTAVCDNTPRVCPPGKLTRAYCSEILSRLCYVDGVD